MNYDAIAHLIHGGYKATEIAAMISCSDKTVQRYAEILELTPMLKTNSREWKHRRLLEKCISALSFTQNTEELAILIGVSKKTVHSLVVEAVNDFGAPWDKGCENCGAKITIVEGEGRFCSRKCARSFATKELTNEQKKKRNAPLLNPEIRAKGIEIQKNNEIGIFAPWTEKRREEHGKTISKALNNPEAKARISAALTNRPVSPETRAKLSESCRAGTLKVIAEGRHVGWQSRNIISYPEKFWMEILDEAGISYEHNKPVPRKSLGDTKRSAFFLDFYIETPSGKMLDLEIDGKQHSYPERMATDAERDLLLTQAGYEIFRAPWANPKNRGEELHRVILEVQVWLSENFEKNIVLTK